MFFLNGRFNVFFAQLRKDGARSLFFKAIHMGFLGMWVRRAVQKLNLLIMFFRIFLDVELLQRGKMFSPLIFLYHDSNQSLIMIYIYI